MSAGEEISNLASLLNTPIRDPLPPSSVTSILSTSPFLPLPSALNLRTLSSKPVLASNKIFRSGSLSHLPSSTLSLLASQYNITTIFDLRSREERAKHPSPTIPGINTIWIPSTADADTGVLGQGTVEQKRVLSDVKPADFVDNDGADGYKKMYGNILQTHKEVYKALFERLKDGGGGVLYHCTAGKDRTGVLSALILALLNAPPEDIAYDYALTRVGAEPFRAYLLKQLLSQMAPNAAPGLEPETGKGLDLPGLEAMCGVRGQNIVEFVKSMEGKWEEGGVKLKGEEMYKGVIGYLTQELGLSAEDLTKIRAELYDKT